MKKLLLIACLCAQNIFAMPCPSTGRLIDTVYSEAETIRLCGQPLSVNKYPHTVNIREDLTYQKKIFGSNVKITLSFSSGKLININIHDIRNIEGLVSRSAEKAGEISKKMGARSDQNLTISGICGPLIQTGNKIDYVRNVCGNPASRKISSSKTSIVTELRYKGTGRNILVFEDGKLVDWKY